MARRLFNRACRALSVAAAAVTVLAATLAMPAGPAGAAIAGGAMVGGGCLTHQGPASDNNAMQVPLGFTIEMWGSEYSNVWMSTNGTLSLGFPHLDFNTLTFGNDPLLPVIAPFFYDGVTTGKPFTYGSTTWEGRAAFCMSYDGVPFVGNQALTQHFQVLLVDRSDIAPGDFDIVFNYDRLQDGMYAAAGYVKYGAAGSLVLPGSNVHYTSPDRLTDGGSNALTKHSYGSGVDGRYIFPVRGGYPLSPDLIVLDTNLPDPGLEVLDTHRSAAVDSSIVVKTSTSATSTRRLTSRTPAVCTVDGTVLRTHSAGACTVTVEYPADGTWGPVGRTVTYTVAPNHQTLNFPVPPNPRIGVPVPLAATSSAGLPLAYSSLTPEVCTVDADIVVPVAPGSCTLLADQPGNATYAAANITVTFPVEETPTVATVTAAPTTVVAGDTVVVDVEVAASGGALPVEYLQGATVTVAGVEYTPAIEAPTVDGDTGSVRLRTTLDDRVHPGPATVEVTFDAHAHFKSTTVTFPLEVTTAAAALTVAGPHTLTYGDPHTITVQLDSDAELPVDGTFAVMRMLPGGGHIDVAVVPAAAGPVDISLPGLPVGAHDLTVEHRDATFYPASHAPYAVEITPIEVTVDLAVDRLIAGLPTTFTVTPSHASLPGTLELFVDGAKVADDWAWAGPLTGTVTLERGDVEVTARFVPDDGNLGFSPAELTATYTVERSGTTVDITTGYTAPTAPDNTGLFESKICVEPDIAGLDARLTGSEVDITIVNAVTGDVRETSEPVNASGCVILMSTQLAAGEHSLTATYRGNDYLAPSSGTATFTVLHAPTTISLDVVGDLGDTYGAPTTLEATLSQPVPGHDRTGEVTFYVNGVELASATLDGSTATAVVYLPVGDDIEVTASYEGDLVHAPATAAPLRFDVAPATPKVTLSVTPERVTLGEISTVTATVTIDTPAITPMLASPFAVQVPTTFAPLALAGSTPSAAAPPVTVEGEVTFYVNGAAVGTHTLVGGTASMDYVFGAGENTVSVTYSGSSNVAPVALDAAAEVTVVVDTHDPDPAPPADGPTPPADGPAGPATAPPSAGAAPADGRRGPREMAHTGADAQTLVSLAASLLVVGAGVLRLRRPTRRRS